MTKLWQDDQELLALMRVELFTAVVGDILDQMGFRHQFLPPEIRALRPDMLLVGRAMTVLEADVFPDDGYPGHNPTLQRPFGLMLEALDDLKPAEIYICSGASLRYALWGELMATRARICGAMGAVLDGFHRDTPGLLVQNFPTFSRGSYAQDQAPRGKVVDYRVRLEFGGVTVRPGDLVFGDIDGVLVIPREAEEEALYRALEKARGEKIVRQSIENGMSAVESFARYGIM